MTIHDPVELLPSVAEIGDVFRDEIAAVGGTVTDVHETPDLLLARAVLPARDNVRPGDAVRAGVALRAAATDVFVGPYTFRQVCSNGAIAAHAFETRHIARVRAEHGVDAGSYEATLVADAVRDAIRASAAPEAFAAVVREMRTAADADAELAIHLLPMLSRFPSAEAARIAGNVLHRFGAQPDRSLYGLRNAVTSLARDTRDPERRWRLEELGGTMGARVVAPPSVAPAGAALAPA